MDSRLAILTVLSTALADGIPAVGGRVDVMRIEPVWGEQELPIILIDFEAERLEERTVAPREYQHTVTVNVLIYCAGDEDTCRVELLGIVAAVEDIMREWQFIRASDVDGVVPAGGDYMVVEDIRQSENISYFQSPNGDRDHVAARLAFDCEFYKSGASDGKARAGVPPRNRLADFQSMMVRWADHRTKQILATDNYSLPSGEDIGEQNAP